MKSLAIFLVGMLLSAHVFADNAGLIVPKNQKLVSVEYSNNGRQTGCGLRATGETGDGLSLNVLITVFSKETGATFGVVKVVARQMQIKDGVPQMEDGRIVYADLGKIDHAWVATESGKRPFVYKDGEMSHADAYMINTEFASTLDFMAAMLQERFNVGLNRKPDSPDQVFRFDVYLPHDEGSRFSQCIGNLRAEMDSKKRGESY